MRFHSIETGAIFMWMLEACEPAGWVGDQWGGKYPKVSSLKIMLANQNAGNHSDICGYSVSRH